MVTVNCLISVVAKKVFASQCYSDIAIVSLKRWKPLGWLSPFIAVVCAIWYVDSLNFPYSQGWHLVAKLLLYYLICVCTWSMMSEALGPGI